MKKADDFHEKHIDIAIDFDKIAEQQQPSNEQVVEEPLKPFNPFAGNKNLLAGVQLRRSVHGRPKMVEEKPTPESVSEESTHRLVRSPTLPANYRTSSLDTNRSPSTLTKTSQHNVKPTEEVEPKKSVQERLAELENKECQGVTQFDFRSVLRKKQ